MPPEKEPSQRGPILRIAVPSPLRRLFDYRAPAGYRGELLPGLRVLVPFGRQRLVGVLIECTDETSIAAGRLKSAIAVIDRQPLLSAALFRTLLWAARYYQHPLGEVLHTALPNRLRSATDNERGTTVWAAGPGAAAADLGRAHRQQALLTWLRQRDEASQDAIEAAGFSRALLRQLQNRGLVQERIRQAPPAAPFEPATVLAADGPRLSDEQLGAVDRICRRLDAYHCTLLDGITGSGKTEVYMQVMARRLAAGRQCLVLVPEIGLTPQTVSRFQERFACPVVTLHSGLGDGARLQAWRAARDGSAGIVIGTRSAIFTDLARPGLIVVDEEHDGSFKQQEGFRYSARDLAVMRAREEDIPIILGSATPGLESLHNAASGKFDHLHLRERAGVAATSAMEIIDIASGTLDCGFSETLLFRLQQHLEQGNQVLVFLNRRGFAPRLSCQDCGWVAECEHCVAQLTVHSQPPGLRCHHCGSVLPLPGHCGACHSPRLSTLGLGTQQIEGFLQARFPEQPVLRIDRDSTRSRRRFDAMLEQIHRGEACILLGTQMLAKGHHFPDITLVAVLDADAGLFSADFRGQEHMAQTILQVAGRSGRAARPGEVLIQSRHAGHASVQALARGSYADIAATLLAERRAAAMPPYAHLALLRAEGKRCAQALDFLEQVRVKAGALQKGQAMAVEQLGPLPAPMEKRAGRYRGQLLFKSESRPALQNFLGRLLPEVEAMQTRGGLRWSLDVDPQDLI